MAEVPITINGVICDLYGKTILGPVKIVGSMMKSGLGVGGGPILPEEPPAGGGGGDAHPEHPIFYPPHPEHPIVLPPDTPTDPPTEPPTNPSDPQWQWVYAPAVKGWTPAFVPGPTDPQPHR